MKYHTFVIIISVLLGIPGGVASSQREIKTYTMFTDSYFAYAPIFVAQHKGFFTQEGITIDHTVYAISDWYHATMNERTDFAFAVPDAAVDWFTHNTSYILIGVYHQDNGALQFIVQPEIPPDQITRIGIANDATVWKLFTSVYFQSHGLSLEGRQFVLIPFEEMEVNLRAGRIQAMVFVGKPTFGEIVLTSEHFPTGLMLITGVKRDVLQTMAKDELKAYWRAVIKANAWANTFGNQQELREILLKEVYEASVTDVTNEAAYAYFRQINKFLTPEEMLRVNTNLKAIIQEFVGFRRTILKQDISTINLDGRIDTSVLMEVLEEMDLADETGRSGGTEPN